MSKCPKTRKCLNLLRLNTNPNGETMRYLYRKLHAKHFRHLKREDNQESQITIWKVAFVQKSAWREPLRCASHRPENRSHEIGVENHQQMIEKCINFWQGTSQHTRRDLPDHPLRNRVEKVTQVVGTHLGSKSIKIPSETSSLKKQSRNILNCMPKGCRSGGHIDANTHPTSMQTTYQRRRWKSSPIMFFWWAWTRQSAVSVIKNKGFAR